MTQAASWLINSLASEAATLEASAEHIRKRFSKPALAVWRDAAVIVADALDEAASLLLQRLGDAQDAGVSTNDFTRPRGERGLLGPASVHLAQRSVALGRRKT